MGVPRSTYYAAPAEKPSEAGARRRDPGDHRGVPVLRLPPGRRRAAPPRPGGQCQEGAPADARERPQRPDKAGASSRTTDSDHDGPIFPFIAKGFEAHGPDQLWVADITYVAIATGFVYLAVCSTPGRGGWSATPSAARIDARLTLGRAGARDRARAARRRAASSTRIAGSQYASERTAAARRARPRRLDEPARQPLRQRQGRELHEDAQGRGGLPRRLRHLRGRRRRPAPLHRGGLQCQAAALRPGLPEPDEFEDQPARAPEKTAA